VQEHAKTRRGIVQLVAVIVLAAHSGAWAQEDDVEFIPRTGTPPARRVGAGTRAPGDSKPLRAVALAPQQTLGYTLSERPTIYFALSRATTKPIEIAVNDLGNVENPVAEVTMEKGHSAGLLKLDLSTLKDAAGRPVTLAEGNRYEVVLASEENPNDNAVTQIARAKNDDAAGKLPPKERYAAGAAWYAKHGVWFDAIDSLNRGLEKKPDDAKLLKMRKNLLNGQGLTQADDGSIREETPARK
jgi:hypothetical protein